MKFYEPVVLCLSLINAVGEASTASSREPPVNIRDDKQLFYAVVNKLCHICNKAKGGHTVTSLMILIKGHNGSTVPEYRFAANNQTTEELEVTASYVRGILSKIGSIPEEPRRRDKVRKSLLYDIIRFNRPRVSIYLSMLGSRAAECFQRCGTSTGDENQRIDQRVVQELANVRGCLGPITANTLQHCTEEEYNSKFMAVIRLLIRLVKSEVGKMVETRAEKAKMPGVTSSKCWSDLLHTIRRVLAYPQSVQFLLLANDRWPQLFRNPMVSFVPSGEPAPTPVRNKSLAADNIVGRMTRKKKQIQIFQDFAQSLQAYGLDERIKAEYCKDTFRPVVHSEVALLDWLDHNGGIDSSRFFNGWMYIGCSKPMCKLCYYYFEEHKSGVDHRPCSGNLYSPWRFPDVLESQGKAAEVARQTMVDRLLQRVRKDAFDIVSKKVNPTYKDADSNTFSATLELEERWTLESSVAADISDATTLIGGFDSLSLAGGVR